MNAFKSVSCEKCVFDYCIRFLSERARDIEYGVWRKRELHSGRGPCFQMMEVVEIQVAHEATLMCTMGFFL